VGPLLRRGLYDGERRQSPAAPGAERRDGVKFQLIGTWRFVDENFCEKERQNICKEKQTSNICFPDVEAYCRGHFWIDAPRISSDTTSDKTEKTLQTRTFAVKHINRRDGFGQPKRCSMYIHLKTSHLN
jgi:hypothetical protein